MASVEIPLAGIAERFSIALNGTTYQLTAQWRAAPLGGWFLDIADAEGVPIISGIAMVTGADLLAQYAYLGIAGGASLFILDVAGGDSAPAFGDLGTDTRLVLVTP